MTSEKRPIQRLIQVGAILLPVSMFLMGCESQLEKCKELALEREAECMSRASGNHERYACQFAYRGLERRRCDREYSDE